MEKIIKKQKPYNKEDNEHVLEKNFEMAKTSS